MKLYQIEKWYYDKELTYIYDYGPVENDLVLYEECIFINNTGENRHIYSNGFTVVHDSILDVKNAKLSALSVQYGVPVQLQTVLSMDDSLTDIVRFLDYCDNLNYNWIGIGYPECMPYTPKDLDIQVWIYANLLNMSSRWQNIILGGAILESIHDYMSGVIYNTSCMCGECSITIQPDGTLTPCYHYRVNEISSVDSISSIKRIREDMLKNTTCVDCDYWGICHGGCLLGGLYHNNNHFTKDPAFCYVLKNLVTKCISVKKL